VWSGPKLLLSKGKVKRACLRAAASADSWRSGQGMTWSKAKSKDFKKEEWDFSYKIVSKQKVFDELALGGKEIVGNLEKEGKIVPPRTALLHLTEGAEKNLVLPTWALRERNS